MKFLKLYTRVIDPVLLALSLGFMVLSFFVGALIFDPYYWFEFAVGVGRAYDYQYGFGFILLGIYPFCNLLVIDSIVCFIIKRHNAQKDSDQSDGSAAGQ